MVAVGIIGASGYTGAELLRLIAAHPHFELAYATGDSQAGVPARQLYPSLAVAYPDLVFEPYDAARAAGLDVVFLGLPHQASLTIAAELQGKVGCVVDLSAAFRLKDHTLYPRWYGFAHDHPELLGDAVYGLPELFRDDLPGASLIATPGCYVTASSLAIAPLVRRGLIEPNGVIIDAASGVSGAGRSLKHGSLFCTVDEDFTAYGLLTHRHTPEIEQNLAHVAGASAQVLFTPHLAPMNRGILATCYARPTGAVTTDSVLEVLHAAYDAEPFVTVRTDPPSTKATLGSNAVHVTACADERTGWVVAVAALDNLTKGASGGAVQAANVALGLPETAGLPTVGLYP